jgi:hypothetical protein
MESKLLIVITTSIVFAIGALIYVFYRLRQDVLVKKDIETRAAFNRK